MAKTYAKYLKIKQEIKQKIAEGYWKPQQKLPSDAQLFKDFNASRLTLIRALQELEKEGLVIRKRGSGTYVSSNVQTARIPTKRTKVAVIFNSHINHNYLKHGFYPSVINGFLFELGFDPQKYRLEQFKPNKASRAIWVRNNSNIQIECLGGNLNSESIHPPIESFTQGNYDCLIVIGFTKSHWIDQLLTLNTPTILVDTSFIIKQKYVDNVHFDSTSGYIAATQYMIDHQLLPIYFLGDNINDENNKNSVNRVINPESIERANAIKKTLELNGLMTSQVKVEHLNDKHAAIEQIFQKIKRLPKFRRPKSLICHDIFTGLALQSLLKTSDIPLTVSGAINTNYKGKGLPILSDGEEMGAVAASLMISRINHINRPSITAKLELTFQSTEAQ